MAFTITTISSTHLYGPQKYLLPMQSAPPFNGPSLATLLSSSPESVIGFSVNTGAKEWICTTADNIARQDERTLCWLTTWVAVFQYTWRLLAQLVIKVIRDGLFSFFFFWPKVMQNQELLRGCFQLLFSWDFHVIYVKEWHAAARVVGLWFGGEMVG